MDSAFVPATDLMRVLRMPREAFDRRRHDRFQVEVHVRLELSLPELRAAPYRFSGQTADVSLGGAKLLLRSLPRAFYLGLLKGRRPCGLRFVNPLNGEEIGLAGRVAWVDFVGGEGPTGVCLLGIEFEAPPADGPYAEFIKTLTALGTDMDLPAGGTAPGLSPQSV